jgi:hypothetical protein
MNQNELTHNQPGLKISLPIVAIAVSVILWVTAILLTAICLFAVREYLLWALATALADPSDPRRRFQAANVINLVHQCSMMVFGVVGLGTMLVISEYFFKHFGQTRLIRTLVKVILIEAAIILPAALLFWRT